MPEPAFDVPDSSPPLPPVPGADASVGKGDAPLASVGKTGGTPVKSIDDLIGPKGDLSVLQEQKIGAEGGMIAAEDRKQAAYRARQERMIAAEGATMDDLNPWSAEKELSSRKTDLWEQFGSPGFVIAMLASSFSGAPMNSALNAGAAAMNAINSGDMDKYEKAYDAWKENSKLTLKRLDLEEKQFDQIGELAKSDAGSAHAKLAATLAQFDDKRKLALYQAGLEPELWKAIEQQKVSKVELQKATDLIEQNEIRRRIINADPDFKSGDPKKMAAAIHRADAAMQGDDSKMTPDQRFQLLWYREHPEGKSDEFAKAYGEFKRGEHPNPGAENVPMVLQSWTDARGGQPPTPEMKSIIQSAYQTKGSIGGSRIAQIGTALATIKQRMAAGERLDDDAQEKILREAVQQAPTGMTLDKESADLIADQYLAGDRMAAAGFARSAQNMAMIRKSIREKAKEQGLSGADLAMRIAEFHGIVSAETAAGRREVTIGMFANEARTVIDIAKRASKDVPRGEFIPFNRAMLAFEKNTGDPKVVKLGAALNAVINTYAKAINGGQQGTVSDKDHAREIVELAYSDNQMDAVYSIMEQELQAALDAPGQVKQSLRDLHSGKVKPAPGDPGVIKYDSSGNRVQ